MTVADTNRRVDSVVRIVAGSAGGRRLLAVPGKRTRPTSDRARAALFATLGTLLDLTDARVLDLYAGSGAVGLEALSRGAEHALLIEADRKAAAVIRRNAEQLDFPHAQIREGAVEKIVSFPPNSGYDMVFADPPYALPDSRVDEVLAALVRNDWLTSNAVIVVERSSHGRGPRWPPGVVSLKQRRYGEGTLWYGRRS